MNIRDMNDATFAYNSGRISEEELVSIAHSYINQWKEWDLNRLLKMR